MRDLFAGYPDQAALDAAYNAEGSVPDFNAYAERFVADSQAAREAHPPELVRYGPTLMESAELFVPAGARDAPVLVFIHGGYWRALDASVFSLIATGPLAAGMAVLNITYDLCPMVPIGEIVRQARAAVAWMHANAAAFGADRERIVVAGHSAGGHLTATTLLADWARYGLPADTVKGGLAISGLFELEPIAYSFMQPMLRFTADDIQRWSPQRTVVPVDAPLTLCWGDADPSAFPGQSMDFARAWQAAGNRCETFEIANANHFEVLDGFRTADGALTQRALQLATPA